jgi:hypothetical protein
MKECEFEWGEDIEVSNTEDFSVFSVHRFVWLNPKNKTYRFVTVDDIGSPHAWRYARKKRPHFDQCKWCGKYNPYHEDDCPNS